MGSDGYAPLVEESSYAGEERSYIGEDAFGGGSPGGGYVAEGGSILAPLPASGSFAERLRAGLAVARARYRAWAYEACIVAGLA